jgi:WD40 repeat protein
MNHSFDVYVTASLFTREGSVFCLGDGTVRFETADPVQAHDGAILCAAAHPSGSGVVTGGDDGRLMWSRPEGAQLIADLGGKWIDAVASEPQGLIAFAAGRTVHVRDTRDAKFVRAFQHERSAADLAFDPKGRKLAVATYGGAAIWFARIADQKPQMLKWAGSHIALTYSPDGRFLISAMQENALHGWRLSDNRDMRMGGYPAKPKSLAFLADGALMATSGATGVIVWPFAGATGVIVWPFAGSNGPMGREAMEIGADEAALVTRVAGHPHSHRVVAGLDDGRIWTADLAGRDRMPLRSETGAAISALTVSAEGTSVAFGAEDGAAGVIPLAV